MDTITTLRNDLNRRKGDWPTLCKATGLSYHWLTKFAQGKIAEPGIRKAEKVQAYIAEHPLQNAANGAHPTEQVA